ncbi:helix-turn-helix domain-containing protein [Shimia abyssi]|uniref:Excisionase family DNA binding protein n=1 Tax=Shimia abyssi TaxID=1662395 RepID=A0A2P8ET36_9RHOB|nr:helix-turn-helix domain-containing protein [Shimia abyssi]PSL12639.1 excisionase family DNA binding protein [Shimia abyssi]
MTNDKQKPMLTVFDVAERMNVSERTVFRWIKEGRLKVFRAARVLRISEADFQDFLDGTSHH